MAETNVPVWIPAVTALGGVIICLFAPWVNSFTVLRKDREAHKESIRDRIRESQRQTLLELQDAVIDMMRAERELHLHDCRNFHEHGRRLLYPEDITITAREAQSSTSKLGSRVRDERIRGELLAVKEQISFSLLLARNVEEAEAAMARAVRLVAPLLDLIGEKIRTIDDEALL